VAFAPMNARREDLPYRGSTCATYDGPAVQDRVASADATTPTTGALEPVRVMVVDRHDLFRVGLCRLLEEQGGLEIVADARTGAAAIEHIVLAHPDVVLVDVELPDMTGIDAAVRLIEAAPASAVVMLTTSEAEGDVLQAVLAGASGYLLKDTPLPELASALRAAAHGGSVISPRLASSLLARVRVFGPPHAPRPDGAHLSERELDVLRLLVAGANNVEIAAGLHCSPSTIKHHVASLIHKLGVENRVQAAVSAVRLNLV
jgi:DNA-binding NarL/FixJ family response regulator